MAAPPRSALLDKDKQAVPASGGAVEAVILAMMLRAVLAVVEVMVVVELNNLNA